MTSPARRTSDMENFREADSIIATKTRDENS
jgi:hypothetical protein